MQFVHINCLELLAVWLALKHFLPLLTGQHALVRTDNTICVNRQGGLHSHHMHTLAHRLSLHTEQLSPIVAESHSCAGYIESGSGLALSRQPSLQGLETTERCGEPNMEQIRPS